MSVRRPDAQTRSKFFKGSCGEPFGHHISELLRRRDMKDTEFAERNLLPNEVDVDLDVLGPPVMDRVGRHVDTRDVVTVDNRGFGDVHAELTEELSKPATLGDDIGDRAVLRLRT